MRSFAPIFALGACLAACGLQVVGSETDGDPVGGQRSGPQLPGQGGAGGVLDPIPAEGGLSGDGSRDTPDADAGVTGTGSALRFANNSYVQIGPLPIPTDFTLEAWVSPSNFGSERYIVAKERNDESDDQFRFGHDGEGRLFFMMSDDDGEDHGLLANDTSYALLSPAALTLGTWSARRRQQDRRAVRALHRRRRRADLHRERIARA